MKLLAFLMLIAIICSSCIPTIIGASVYKSSKTRESKERFMAQYNQTNIEREKAGLAPLDLCTEQYYFDKKWADNDPICEERIIRYEGGDKSALGHPELETVDAQAVETTDTEEPEIQRTEGKQPIAP
ncbi:MAG: hypothetical protein DHS20C13_24200 [Thermodesulfobacteriota bacterium]|nr:MAG: hypothetical protein DHS20C13_24200 [Thermodesulfobacteriota bacterium]